MLVGKIGTDDAGSFLELRPEPATAWGAAHALHVAHSLAAELVKTHGMGTPITVTGGWDGSPARVHVRARRPGKPEGSRAWGRAIAESGARLWTATGWRVLAGVRIERPPST